MTFVKQCTRPEYKEFDLTIFTRRVYQQMRRKKFVNWMEEKRKEGDPLVKQLSLYAP